MSKLFFTIVIAVAIFSEGCKKLTDVNPPLNKITSSQAFSNDESAIESISGIYSTGSGSSNLLSGSTTIYPGMYADEFVYTGINPRSTEFYTNVVLPDNQTIKENFWGNAYELIYIINNSLEQLSGNKKLSENINNQLTGECKFLRAFLYFELIELFGEVPLITTTDYTINAVMPRTSLILIKQKIVEDLTSAKTLLSSAYPAGEKNRANKWAAVSLLSRFYLYQGEWSNAEKEASEVIDAGIYHLEPNADMVFLANSAEAIFQISPVLKGYNTMEGNILIPSASSRPLFALTPSLAGSFESNDKRKTAWVASKTINSIVYQYPFKYKQRANFTDPKLTEYTTVIRLAELYLIRAESRTALHSLPAAIEDLDTIRYRAGLPLMAAVHPDISQADLLAAIQKERRVELFAEWGHRWFDLKRTGAVNETLAAIKPRWKESDTLWPVPSSQIGLNPALIQNSGY